MNIRFFEVNRKALAVILSIAVLIWLIGPLITIAGKTPLLSVTNRLLLILIVAIIWGAHLLRQHIDSINTQRISEHPEKTSEIAALSLLFKSFKTFLRKQYNKKYDLTDTYLYQKPWVMMIGPSGSGKTSILRNHDLQHQHVDQHLQDNHLCNWRIVEETVFIDTNGQVFLQDQELNKTLWLELISLLKNHRRRKPIDAIIITVSLYDLFCSNDKKITQLTASLKAQLFLLSKQIKTPFPVFILFNKADRVLGFTEFFGDLSSEERQQVFGIHFDNLTTSALSHYFDEEFDRLLQPLNERVIWRLHQERSQENRVLIKDFPLQLETLKSMLNDFITSFANDFLLSDNIRLQGVYFTSAIQKGLPFDGLIKKFKSAFALTPVPIKSRSMQTKAYFTQQLFKNIILPASRSEFKSNHLLARIEWKRLASYAFSGLLVMAFFWYSMAGLQYQKQQLSKAQALLAQYHYISTENKQDLQTIIKSLNVFTELNNTLNKKSPGTLKQHFSSSVTALAGNAKLTYEKLLKKKLLPELQNIAYHQLFNISPNRPQQIYQMLKLYLMLGEPKHLDQKFVSSWLQQSLSESGYSHQQVENVISHLNVLLSLPLPKTKLNGSLIKTARGVLYHLTSAQLAFVIAGDSQPHAALQILPNGQPIFMTAYAAVPQIYTAKGFERFMQTNFNPIVQEAVYGNWVLGSNAKTDISAIQLQTITNQLINLYKQNYLTIWNNVINGIQLKPTLTLAQNAQLLATLTSQQSILMSFYNSVSENVVPILSGKININDFIKNHEQADHFIAQLKAIDTVTRNPNMLQVYFASIQSFYNAITRITTTNDPNQAAFLFVKETMQNKSSAFVQLKMASQNLPEPIPSLSQQITDSTWQFILQQSHQYIDQQWQQVIVPFYLHKLAGKYPFDNNAFAQVQLQDFIEFFAPQGLLASFTQEYLAPFVEFNDQKWELKTLYGKSLDINKQSLLQLQLSSYITKMYFPHDQKTLKINFSLQPLALEPVVKKFELMLDNKVISYDHDGAPKESHVTWPSDNVMQHVARLMFTTINGDMVDKIYAGPWALFKALQAGNLIATNNPKQFEVTFDLNGNSAKYLLTTTEPLNPFISDVVDELKLPASL